MSNNRTGRICIKFFSSTNSSEILFNGACTTRGLAYHPTGQNFGHVSKYMSQRDRLQRPYGKHQRLESHQAVQTLGGEGKQDKGESRRYPSYKRTADPDSSLQEKTMIQQEQDLFQPKAERVRPNDTEAVGLGERSTQKPEIVVHTSRINSPINRNITPTQIRHNVVTTESNVNSDALWLQMSQYAEKTQKQLSELQASHERMKKLTASMNKIVQTFKRDMLN
ncbi:hypothetical protein O181_067861 [Austropuccinia psidii MF-1]|uniref:Uncharacterized protein n=1 Tax=Austropuccinia psidii MF-1 TaxID=1389203 RepID=A0A9Q3I3G3_9BASI|nr:hypothetical protein [Austropuccinia psidii MF-1]